MTTIRVVRAADTIGGNCIEITARTGERILLDAGAPLDLERGHEAELPPGLDTAQPCLGVFISHSHLDHHGLLRKLPAQWPVFCGAASWDIIQIQAALGARNDESAHPQQTPHLFTQNHNSLQYAPVRVGPFTVTPYLTDHSAFDAYMLLIEVDGKRILYSGDFRAHGRKSALTERFLAQPPQDIDCLLMEGTNAVFCPAGKSLTSEQELEKEFVDLFAKTPGRVFVSASGTNIDRLVTIYRACIRTGRLFVVDLYTMEVLHRLGQYAIIPQPEWEDSRLRAVVTTRMTNTIDRIHTSRGAANAMIEQLKHPNRRAIGAASLNKQREKWVVMMRGSMVEDFRNKGVEPDKGDAWIWSQWRGYLEDPKNWNAQQLLGYFGAHAPQVIHTSGHAGPDVLARFAHAVRPACIIPIHGQYTAQNQTAISGLYAPIPVRFVQNGEEVIL